MAVTRSWQPEVITALERPAPLPVQRKREAVWLAGASLFIACGLLLTYTAKTQDLREDGLLNLNTRPAPQQIAPFLFVFPEGSQRNRVAEEVARLTARGEPLPNVGALARVPAGQGTLRRWLPQLKPYFVVRTAREHLTAFLIWSAAYFGAFWMVHLLWRWRRFGGDGGILPALHLLTGIGLMLSLSIRDPLRDTFEFQRFSAGVAAGCCFLLLPLLKVFDYRRYSRLVYLPLLGAFALFAALAFAGSGPTGSDSKVNLGPFQPVEVIKVLLVFFMAGYFAQRWEWLRETRERAMLPRWLLWIDIPRVRDAVPVMCGTAAALTLFFVLRDLGPALVTGFLFLTMFAVARARAGLAILGMLVLVCGVWIGYRTGTPRMVVDRIGMWTSPWDNDVRGGDQIAHSYWALASGGAFGSGPGWGDPVMIPAGHTDLVVPAIGEELGAFGVAAVAILFAFLFRRALAAARSALDEYGFFLAVGCASLIAIEMLFISAGVLGVIPLSGVASPFLSLGTSAMLANFFLFAVIAGVSSRPRTHEAFPQLAAPTRWIVIPFAAAAFMLVVKTGSIQVFGADLIAKESRVIQEDGVKRAQYNPRLNSLARELTRGDIVDRNGAILATTHRNRLGRAARLETREYPYGPLTAHLLGDLRTREKFHATNASLIEYDQNAALRGFDNYRELAPYVRIRHQPNNAAMNELRARDRTVRTSIDVRLQAKAAGILARRLEKVNQQRGALVVMRADTGDILAMVSAPATNPEGTSSDDQLLDRARYGQYPPGSTFKLVTAIAALRSDPTLEHKRHRCAPLGDGRVGARIPAWRRPIRDDIGDPPHGNPDMERALIVSCNAYFAQLGVDLGARALVDISQLIEVSSGELKDVQQMLPFAAYGQGTILVTPFKLARVASLIAAHGMMPQGRWILDASNPRSESPRRILDEPHARFIAKAMRSVVTHGTGRRAMSGLNIAVAGKTGTAQVDHGPPHSWFTGFAPYDAPPAERLAFAVVVEHGGYGAQAAAPVARELVEAARDLGIIRGAR
jgi:cell division protein FtsI/penicillin-binding protein 2/cell division protein FtsW (lipid II flippase)